jgi:hypothetical protein
MGGLYATPDRPAIPAADQERFSHPIVAAERSGGVLGRLA